MLEQAASNKTGWTPVAFGDVVRLSKARSKNPESDGHHRVVGLEHIDPGDLRIRRWADIADGTTFSSVFQRGQVLFGKRRAYQRKVAVAEFAGVCSGDIYVLEPSSGTLSPELLPFICQSDAFFEHAVGTSAGSLSPRTNWKSLAGFEFLLPPTEVQADFVRAQKAAIDAFETMLVLCASAKDVFKSALKDLSDRTSAMKIGALVKMGAIEPPQDGNHGEKHPKGKDYVEIGIPFVMASDLREGRVDIDRCKKLNKSLADKLRVGFAKAGDVLLSHKGTVGEVAKVGDIETDYVMLTPQVTYYRVKDTDLIDSEWLFYVFQSPTFQMQLRRYERQSTRAFIGITAQRELEVAFCGLNEQREHLARLRPLRSAIRDAVKRRANLRELQFRMVNQSCEA